MRLNCPSSAQPCVRMIAQKMVLGRCLLVNFSQNHQGSDMPPTFDAEDPECVDVVVDDDSRRIYAPPANQKIHWATVAFLILNRTIGSGIFVSSASVLQNTHSSGVSLILWAVGGLLILCIVLVWLEFGLSTPVKRVAGDVLQCVPRSGGEKNYVSLLSTLGSIFTISSSNTSSKDQIS